MRLVDAVCLIIAIGGAAYVYNVKHKAELAHDDRRTLEREISAMSQDVGLLEADLAALEQPARLQAVISGLPEAFALEPIASAQYVHLSDIPFRADLVDLNADEALNSEPLDDSPTEEPIALAPSQLDLLLQGLMSEAPGTEPGSSPLPDQDSIGALLEGVMPEERP